MSAIDPLQLDQDTTLATHLLDKLAEDLGMLLDRPLTIESLSVARSANKVAGERLIHVAFKLGIMVDGALQHGALLVPLPDALSFACYLMMVPDDVVLARRKDGQLDRATKDAMVEVGNLLGGTFDGALRDDFAKRVSARSEGCQGLKPGVAPAFERTPGVDLFVARARLKLHTFPAFEVLLMLPVIPPPE